MEKHSDGSDVIWDELWSGWIEDLHVFYVLFKIRQEA